MTEQIYLTNAYLQESKAKVLEVGESTDGHATIVLDQTIFYPQGGGQPSDKGTITTDTGTLTVKSVDYNAGSIKHIGILKGKIEIGQKADLKIDWPTRFKHMQMHTIGHFVDLVVRELHPSLVPIRGMHGIGKKLFIEYEGVHALNKEELNGKLQKLLTGQATIETTFVTLDELKKIANWIPAKLPTSKKLRVLSIGEVYHIPDGGTQLKTGETVWESTITNIETTANTTLVHYSVTQPTKKSDLSNSQDNSDDFDSKIRILKISFEESINDATSEKQLESLRLTYLGKKGTTTQLLQQLPKLSTDDKRTYGPMLNQLKIEQENAIEMKTGQINAGKYKDLDLTIPGTPRPIGRLHPTTTIIREMNSFFRRLGFSVGEGPEIETAEFNFHRLGVPEGHPATDLQDSLFIREPDILLRTQTSSIETRILSSENPPLRVVVPGKCYRNETTSLTNSAFFFQYQGFVVDRGISIAHLKDTLTQFHQFLFGPDVILRFRYKYYPEVSPGMGVDYQCPFCEGKGCQVCKGRGWIEALGSGMIHVNTLRACGIDPEVYSGYAFGMGLDRMVMSKYGITDIRKLYGGELVYK